MNTHIFLTATIDSELLSDAEVVAFSRLLDFLAAYRLEHYTFTLDDLGNLWGRTRPLKRRQVREYVSALKRLPWLDVVSASGQVVISLRADRLPRAGGANGAENGAGDAKSGANDALPVQSGGDYRGGDWLVASGSDPVRVTLLFQGITSELGWGTEASNQASNQYGAALHRYRIDSAQLAHQERIDSASLPPHPQGAGSASLLQRERTDNASIAPHRYRTDSAQLVHRERIDSASALPDVPDDLLRAVLDALAALPPEDGVSESGARAIIAEALARDIAPEAILAVALAVGARAKAGRRVGGGLFRSLVGKPDPAREVPRAFLAQAREILGLQDEGEDERGDTGPGVYEVPLSASQRLDLPRARRAWDEALQALIRQGESWAKEAGLVAYDAGERTFLVEGNRGRKRRVSWPTTRERERSWSRCRGHRRRTSKSAWRLSATRCRRCSRRRAPTHPTGCRTCGWGRKPGSGRCWEHGTSIRGSGICFCSPGRRVSSWWGFRTGSQRSG